MHEKLKAKLQYSIDLGIDFLVRNIWDDGRIIGIDDLYQHFVGTLCIIENLKDIPAKVLPAIRRVSSFTYSKNDMFFIYDKKEDVRLTILAAIIFLRYNEKNAYKYLNYINSIEHTDNFGLLIYLYCKFYEHDKKEEQLNKAKELCSHLNNFNDYWNIVAISCLSHLDKCCRNLIKNVLSNNGDSFDILCHFGNQNETEWKNVEVIALNKISSQIVPSDQWRGGAFVDELDNPRLDWAFQNICSFKNLLENLKNMV